ncbi:MAG: hypothetical protein H6707_10310 [Deltaproteobacteria bacterium]|nr:hypothetical protein [Deltaproteobacteria bacterium]
MPATPRGASGIGSEQNNRRAVEIDANAEDDEDDAGHDDSDDSDEPRDDAADDQRREPQLSREIEYATLPRLTGRVGFAVLNRRLSFRDDLFGQLWGYALAGAPALSLELDWFAGTILPGAWRHVGLTGQLNYALAIRTGDASTESNQGQTRAYDFAVGLVGQLPWGQQRLRFVLSYFEQRFDVPAREDAKATPKVHYRGVRVVLGGRFTLPWRLATTVQLGVVPVLSAGEIGGEAFFPRAVVTGVDGDIRLSRQVVSWLELELGVQLRRYFFKMNSVPGDARVAGGAVDQYLSGTLSAVARY